jgi:hypothetical protein
VPVQKDEEEWSFYLYAPRFQDMDAEKVTYQIEVGEYDPDVVDEYQVKETFAWRFNDGKMYTGTQAKPVYLTVRRRVGEIEGGKFTIRTVQEARMQYTDLKYGFTRLAPPVSGTDTARRTKPKGDGE